MTTYNINTACVETDWGRQWVTTLRPTGTLTVRLKLTTASTAVAAAAECLLEEAADPEELANTWQTPSMQDPPGTIDLDEPENGSEQTIGEKLVEIVALKHPRD